MIRENDKKLFVREHTSRPKVFLGHRRANIACTECGRYGVRKSLLPVSELLLIFLINALTTTLAILHMTTMTWKTTTKEVEDGHHIQPVLGSDISVAS